MSGGELPPVAASSSLIAPMPMVESRDIDADGGDGGGVSFGTQDLAMALTRSQQHNNVGGMRRTCSAPHSMDALGVPDVLAPSGGPMRRVASSVGMRRSNSFFWTPAAHHEFEAACEELARSGIVPTAPAILHAMAARPDLKIADIDKHLKVSTRTPRRARNAPPSSPSPPARSAAPALALRRPPTAPLRPAAAQKRQRIQHCLQHLSLTQHNAGGGEGAPQLSPSPPSSRSPKGSFAGMGAVPEETFASSATLGMQLESQRQQMLALQQQLQAS